MASPSPYRPPRILGTFKPSKQGGWEGIIRTLTFECKLRLVPNDNRTSSKAPAYRVLLGWQCVGEAWEGTSRTEDGPPPFLRVDIDDPIFPIQALLYPNEDGTSARLIWNRPATRLEASHG